uniref:Uncharacterized protein n=1 Tax=Oryza glumipatula TaxID=40148 RepID=A0A0D9Y7H5_9ORYZ
MSRRQLQLGEVQASWKNLMTIPPRRGEVFPNGLDDGVRAPSNGAPAFSSNSLAMSVRKVAGPSKMIEKTSTVTEETATSVKASPASGVSVRRPHTIAITTAASLGLGVGAMMPAQWQALTGWHSVDSATGGLMGTASVWASPIRWTRWPPG